MTRLVTLRVDAVLRGQAQQTLDIEEEASLADGTPIVNGLRALDVGDAGTSPRSP